MISKEEYKKTLVRMWDSVRDDDYKGADTCYGVNCTECPTIPICSTRYEFTRVENIYELIEFVEKWAKEHPIETNGSRFLKNYPKAVVYSCDSNDDGFVYLGLDCTKPFVDGENSTKFPKTW